MIKVKPEVNVIASGLGFIEGPAVADGVIYTCDIRGGRIWQVSNGLPTVLSTVGGGPNGIAIGPDGQIYVANNGGNMRWESRDGLTLSHGFQTQDYDSRIESIDLDTKQVERIVDNINGTKFEAIDDLVFDSHHGFWFTDLGRDGDRHRTYGGVYWASGLSGKCREVAYPLEMGANGLGLSPDGKKLYATEYGAGRLWSWDIDSPGYLKNTNNDSRHGGKLVWQAPDAQLLDSLAIAADGNIFVATQPLGVFSVITPNGLHIATLEMPEHFPTNLCFDPDQPNAAYVTLSSTGILARVEWDSKAF
ncbi:SMP-30/gluconolactonase/LRE family protein [Pseudomonas fulva]|uniref:SMP-30/gluconolactonase/LRE family protein n=1 Tax=Pseudomonas fulva TaxID=47880 RepID=UPI00201E0E70|nr:SMP-30/gluconolactonase/LRE family protein [Pseudomonas fulva]UQY33990.1 SMP-30/gluconolactonase/LRE family protein [Pseudomonas fulva]